MGPAAVERMAAGAEREPCRAPVAGLPIAEARMTEASTSFPGLVETFPGNLASFARESLQHSDEGAQLVIDAIEGGMRPYRSGAFASVRSFRHGRFEAEIRAARGFGAHHRILPASRLTTCRRSTSSSLEPIPGRMLANVYFNPGDDGTAMGFGYRGSPCRIDLGFDATEDFHLYAIDWQAGPRGLAGRRQGRP